MHNGYKIIDADAHIHEPHDLWSDFMEAGVLRPASPWSHRGRRVKRHSSSKQFLPCELFPEGSISRGTVQGAGQKRQVVRSTDFMGEKYGDAWYAEFTPESRVVDMDRYGWDKQVMIDNFPAAMRLISEGADQGLLWACARAYNNWSYDFAQADPTKLKVSGVLPNQHDIEGLIIETRRVVEKLGAVTVAVPTPDKGKALARPRVRRLLGPGRGAGLPHVLPRRQQRRPPRGHPLQASPPGLRPGGGLGARPGLLLRGT